MNSKTLELDNQAKALGKDYLRMEGELLSILMQMKRARIFAKLNYMGIFDYCHRALNLSKSQAFYFKSVAEKAMEVPELKTAIDQGDLTLSQARRIVPAVNATNHQEWIAKATQLTQDELEREVQAVNPKARVLEKIKPIDLELSELKVGVNRETKEDLTQLKEILSQKLGKAATLSDVIAWMAKECRKKFDPTHSKIISSGNRPLKAGRHPVRVSTRKAVYQREEGRCTFVSSDSRRCSQKRWLNLHHIVEVSNGGLNTEKNLTLLCHAHHQLIHREDAQ